MQMQADPLDRHVSKPETVETTALGAAKLNGLVVGFLNDADELAASWQEERSFEPQRGNT